MVTTVAAPTIEHDGLWVVGYYAAPSREDAAALPVALAEAGLAVRGLTILPDDTDSAEPVGYLCNVGVSGDRATLVSCVRAALAALRAPAHETTKVLLIPVGPGLRPERISVPVVVIGRDGTVTDHPAR